MFARLNRIKILLITFMQLGVMSIARVVCYRLLMKLGYYRRSLKIKSFSEKGAFFAGLKTFKRSKDITNAQGIILSANKLLDGSLQFFSHFDYQFKKIPDWVYDPFTQNTHRDNAHWSMINEFSFQNSDVKILWEASRFSWAPTLAQAYVLTQDKKYLETLNDWIHDWCEKNPANQGIQWKCGQEASIRVLHFLTAMRILGEIDSPQPRSIEFVALHLERISLTTFYAQAQRNNHLTSEAAALFVGGCWLQQHRASFKQAERGKSWSKKGLRLLEWAASSLIYSDGSFSQHSVVYHRVMLDTYSLCEIWREYFSLPKFSTKLYAQLQKATDWLFCFADPTSGDAPNLGGNDGAHLFNLGMAAYRDFRPSVQLASHLFHGKCFFSQGPWDDHVKWFCGPDPKMEYSPKPRVSKLFSQGGYYIHVSSAEANVWFLLRLPYFKDRPAHSDALHFDLWSNGKNILSDSGSYSYSAGDKSVIASLKGVAGHNTIQFDNHDQMPVLGRFLFGDWLRGKWSIGAKDDKNIISAKYKDFWKNSHSRTITIDKNIMTIVDEISGSAKNWTLRWHLNQTPDMTTMKSGALWSTSHYTLNVLTGDLPRDLCNLSCSVSHKYLEVKMSNCIAITDSLQKTCKVITEIRFDI